MTYPIKQIQASYSPVEDRILLTIKSHYQQIYLGWITRRFLKILLPALHGQHPVTGVDFFEKALSKGPKIATSKAILQRGSTSKKKSFEAPEYPLGESPLLFSKITFNALHSQQAILILAPESGQGIKLPFTPELLNLLLKTLKQPLHESDWNLEVNTIYGVPSNSRLQ